MILEEVETGKVQTIEPIAIFDTRGLWWGVLGGRLDGNYFMAERSECNGTWSTLYSLIDWQTQEITQQWREPNADSLYARVLPYSGALVNFQDNNLRIFHPLLAEPERIALDRSIFDVQELRDGRILIFSIVATPPAPLSSERKSYGRRLEIFVCRQGNLPAIHFCWAGKKEWQFLCETSTVVLLGYFDSELDSPPFLCELHPETGVSTLQKCTKVVAPSNGAAFVCSFLGWIWRGSNGYEWVSSCSFYADFRPLVNSGLWLDAFGPVVYNPQTGRRQRFRCSNLVFTPFGPSRISVTDTLFQRRQEIYEIFNRSASLVHACCFAIGNPSSTDRFPVEHLEAHVPADLVRLCVLLRRRQCLVVSLGEQFL